MPSASITYSARSENPSASRQTRYARGLCPPAISGDRSDTRALGCLPRRRRSAHHPRLRGHDRATAGQHCGNDLARMDILDQWSISRTGPDILGERRWSLLSALVTIATGVVLLVAPIQGTYALTIVLGAYFLAEGVASILYAFEHRRELTGRWS